MYLVLTALLALNVSSTVIDKFVFLDDSLVRANNEMEERSSLTLKSIKKTVEDTGNREDDKRIANSADELRLETQRVMANMNELKDTLVILTGGYLEEYQPEYKGDAKNLMGKTDYDKVGHFMMPLEEGGLGRGSDLKALLNNYATYTRDLVKKHGGSEEDIAFFANIALDADEDPIYSKDHNQKGKAFSTLAFDGSPTPAGLATISEFQSRVLGYEARALSYLSGKVGAGDLKFDRIVPMVLPESKYVAAGTKYSARMFIAASSSGVTPTMTYNDRAITVDASGQGLVEFTATASNYDKDGLAKQSYKAAITVAQPGGRDTTFTETFEYFVVRPVIQIQSQSVNALYLNCGNKLDIQVPALGTSYNPAFTAKNGDAIKGADKGQVTIVPKVASEVELTIASNGSVIGTRSFGVRRIPAPEIRVYLNPNEQVNEKTGISSKTPRLYLKAVPDESFAQFLPEDANFRIASAEVTLVSGGIGRKTIQAGEVVDLSAIAAQARKGDQIVIEIKKVQRQNFKKEVEDFGNFRRFVNISLN